MNLSVTIANTYAARLRSLNSMSLILDYFFCLCYEYRIGVNDIGHNPKNRLDFFGKM